MSVAVIIPVKDRVEVGQCVESLLAIAAINRIVICDGGSTDSRCKAMLNRFEQHPNVQVLNVPMIGFNKSRLINQGIQHVAAQVLLISDADIIWNEGAIEALLESVTVHPGSICYVQTVVESDSNSVAVKRDRYTYTIHLTATEAIVEVMPAVLQEAVLQEAVLQEDDAQVPQWGDRPGCGLICARRTTLLALGGYKELFQGWGWEDQDLLIRAALLKMPVHRAGSVVHLSHTDTSRNQHCDRVEPSHTRDQNILACLHSLAEGAFLGDLLVSGDLSTLPASSNSLCPPLISIRLPAALLSKNCHETVVTRDLSQT